MSQRLTQPEHERAAGADRERRQAHGVGHIVERHHQESDAGRAQHRRERRERRDLKFSQRAAQVMHEYHQEAPLCPQRRQRDACARVGVDHTQPRQSRPAAAAAARDAELKVARACSRDALLKPPLIVKQLQRIGRRRAVAAATAAATRCASRLQKMRHTVNDAASANPVPVVA